MKRPRKAKEKVVATMEFYHEAFGEVFKGQLFVVNLREGNGSNEMLYLIDENGKRGKASAIVFELAPDSPLPEKRKEPTFFHEMEIPKNLDPKSRVFRVKTFSSGERILNVRRGDLLELKNQLDQSYEGEDLYLNLRTKECGKYPRNFLIEISRSSKKYEEYAVPNYDMNISGCEIKKGKAYGISGKERNGTTLLIETPKGEKLTLAAHLFEIKTESEVKKKQDEGDKLEEDEESLIPYQEMLRFENAKGVVEGCRDNMYSLMLQVDQLQKQLLSKKREMQIAISKAKHINPLYVAPPVPKIEADPKKRRILSEEEGKEPKCNMCFEAQVSTALSCGHLLCGSCYAKKLHDSGKCPWCQKEMLQAKKVFID